ncbi:MAG TPA: sigma-70 family RNA polymerase sigma factor [Terriglobales bacterium]|nr:sigma-70 family RNA polymerase sigma factor [Terriglobales bacterium]
MHLESNDGDLLRRMAARDEAAFTTLYQRYQGGIYRFARQMTGGASLAEEVTQEVFLTLMREGRSFNASRGSLRAWLYGVARNCTLRCLERERPYVSLETEGGGENAPELVADPCVPEEGWPDWVAGKR